VVPDACSLFERCSARRTISWIAIRVLGLYLLLRRLSPLLAESAGRFAWGMVGTYTAQAFAELLQASLYLYLGRYLIRDGRRVFAWVRPVLNVDPVHNPW